MILSNNSESDFDLDVEVTLRDEAGNMVGVESSMIYAFQHGTQIPLIFSVDNLPASTDIKLTPSESIYPAVDADLSFELAATESKAILSVTNNGTIPAQFVEGYALFFLGDTLVDTDRTYFVDANSEIAPGDSNNNELNANAAFDSVKVYLHGRGPAEF